MTYLSDQLQAGLATASIASSSGSVPGSGIVAAAGRLATWLDSQPPGLLVCSVTGPASTAVCVLAGDLASRSVLHADPASPATPAGILVRDTVLSGAEYQDNTVGITATPGDCRACLDDVPAGSQLFLTSGSTGQPVTVVRSPGAVLADAQRVMPRMRYRPGTRTLVCAPVHHVYGFTYGLLAPLCSGGIIYYCGPRVIPSQLGRAVRRHEAEVLVGHPALYRLLADDAAQQTPADLRPLARAVSAGAPLPAGAAAAIQACHQFGILNCYGSSEAGAVTLYNVDGIEAAGDVGLLLEGIEAHISDGELLLACDSLAKGYLGPTGLMPLNRSGDWYRTGDFARLDGTRVHLEGRIANVINVAGEKVSPEEIEAVLTMHPSVTDAHAFPEGDSVRGQVPVAMVTLSADCAVSELVRWCRGRLEPHKVPRRIEVRAQLERSPLGKRLRTSGNGSSS